MLSARPPQVRFWLERFRDAWESCSHKKEGGGGSRLHLRRLERLLHVGARLGVFMLVVARKLHQ